MRRKQWPKYQRRKDLALDRLLLHRFIHDTLTKICYFSCVFSYTSTMSPIKSAMRPSSALLRYLRAMNTTVAAAPLCNTSGSTSERLSLLQRQKRRCASNRAYIALGSNIGDRIGAIETACRELDQNGLRVLRTSSLYETAPMYVEDQDSFLNAVCEV